MHIQLVDSMSYVCYGLTNEIAFRIVDDTTGYESVRGEMEKNHFERCVRFDEFNHDEFNSTRFPFKI